MYITKICALNPSWCKKTLIPQRFFSSTKENANKDETGMKSGKSEEAVLLQGVNGDKKITHWIGYFTKFVHCCSVLEEHCCASLNVHLVVDSHKRPMVFKAVYFLLSDLKHQNHTGEDKKGSKRRLCPRTLSGWSPRNRVLKDLTTYRVHFHPSILLQGPNSAHILYLTC